LHSKRGLNARSFTVTQPQNLCVNTNAKQYWKLRKSLGLSGSKTFDFSSRLECNLSLLFRNSVESVFFSFLPFSLTLITLRPRQGSVVGQGDTT